MYRGGATHVSKGQQLKKMDEPAASPIISLPRFIGGLQSDLNNVETTPSLTRTTGYKYRGP